MYTQSLHHSTFAVLCYFFLTLCVTFESSIMNCSRENPICDSIEDNCDYITLDGATEINQSSHNLSILQLNIQGLLSKQHILKET